MIGYIFLGIIIIGWLYCITKKNKENAICFLLIMSTIYYESFTIVNIDVVIKALFILTFLILIHRYKTSKKVLLLISMFFIFCIVNLSVAKFDNTFSISDSLFAYISLFSGFIAQFMVLSERQKNNIIKILIKLPIYSLIFGIVLWPLGLVDFFGRYDRSAIAGASLATNLSFFGVVGIASAFLYYRKTNEMKYSYMAYFNFFIVCSTLTRGGILVGIFLIIVDVFPFLIKMCKKAKTFFIMLTVIIMGAYPVYYVVNQLMARTAVNGDSGRLAAWTYIISLNKNRWFGNGYGFLKTREDSRLTFFTAAHNEYVHLYVEVGIIGIAVISIIFIYLFRRMLKNKQYHMITKITIILAFIVLSIFDNTITNFRFWIPFMMLLTCVQLSKGNQANEFN